MNSGDGFEELHVVCWPTGLSSNNYWVTGALRARNAKGGSHPQELILQWERQTFDPKQHSTVINTLLKVWARWCQITEVSSDFQKRWHMTWTLNRGPAWTTVMEYLLQPGTVLWALFTLSRVSLTTVTPGQSSFSPFPHFFLSSLEH